MSNISFSLGDVVRTHRHGTGKVIGFEEFDIEGKIVRLSDCQRYSGQRVAVELHNPELWGNGYFGRVAYYRQSELFLEV